MAQQPAYPPATLVAIRTAREQLYAAQAKRRRVILLTNKWMPPRERDVSPVKAARQDLDRARDAARRAAEMPKGDSDADV
jgi:hypothetical protein